MDLFLVHQTVTGSEGSYNFQSLEELPSSKTAVVYSDTSPLFKPFQGWDLTNTSAADFSQYLLGVLRSSASFVPYSTLSPKLPAINSAVGNAFRTPEKYDGTFDAGNWVIRCRFSDSGSRPSPYWQTRIQYLISSSPNPGGQGSVPLINVISTTPLPVDVNLRDHYIVVNQPTRILNNEYLFLQMGCYISGPAQTGKGSYELPSLNNRANSVYSFGSSMVLPPFHTNQYLPASRVSRTATIRSPLTYGDLSASVRQINLPARTKDFTNLAVDSSLTLLSNPNIDRSSTFGPGGFEFGVKDSDWRIDDCLI